MTGGDAARAHRRCDDRAPTLIDGAFSVFCVLERGHECWHQGEAMIPGVPPMQWLSGPGAAMSGDERADVPDEWVDRITGLAAELAWSGWNADEVNEWRSLTEPTRLLAELAARDARVRDETLQAAAKAVVGSVSYGAELNYDGTENPGMAAYVEGLREAHEIITALRDGEQR